MGGAVGSRQSAVGNRQSGMRSRNEGREETRKIFLARIDAGRVPRAESQRCRGMRRVLMRLHLFALKGQH